MTSRRLDSLGLSCGIDRFGVSWQRILLLALSWHKNASIFLYVSSRLERSAISERRSHCASLAHTKGLKALSDA